MSAAPPSKQTPDMRRFVQWLPVLILIPLWGGSLVLDRIAERVLLDSVHERMVTALHAHQRHVLAMLAHQQQSLRLFAVDATASLAGAPTGRKVPVLHGPFLASLMPEAVGCLLFDARGQMVAHTEEKAPSFEIHVPAGLTEARVSDPSVDADGRSFYDIILPLRSDSRQVGTLACRSENILSYSVSEHRQDLGLTGEVYLVSAKTRLMLTESRSIPNAIGRVNVDTIGMREALKMRNGIAPYPDYRGIPVVGAFLYLKDYDWILLAEMDEAEALAPLHRLRMVVGLSLGLISVAAGAVGWRYGRQLREAYAQTEDARDQAQQGEAQVKALLSSMTDAVFEIDESSTILIANESAHRMFGWPSGELIGRNVTVLMPPEDVSRHEAGLRRYLETGESRIIGKCIEVTGLRRDGSRFPCEMSVAMMTLPDGARRFIGVHRDITERLQAERRNRMLTQAMRTAMDGVVLVDPQAVIIETNPAFDRMFGYERGELIGRQVSCLYPPAWLEKELPAIVAATRETGWTGEVLGLRKDGSTFPRWVSTSPLRDPEGRLTGMLSVSRDLTERNEAKEELEQTHAALNAQYGELQGTYAKIEQAKKEWEATFDAIADPLFVHDHAFRIARANQAYADAAGMPPAELIGKLYYEVFPKMEGPFKKCLKAMEQVVRTEEEEEEEQVPGQTPGKIYRTRIFSRRDSAGKYVHSIHVMEDITMRKQADEKLCLQSAALEATANGIVIAEPDGAISWVNPAFTALTGYGPEEVIGKNPRILQSGKQDPSFYADLWRTISSGNVWHGELINRRKNGTLYTEEQTITPMRDAGGTTRHYIAIKQDITARKRAEAALMRQKDIYNTLSQTNEAIVRCASREELFHEICRIAVLHGHFLFAWIGLLSADGRRVEPVARYGEDAGYVEQVRVSAASADVHGQGPAGETLADGQHATSNDFLNDPATAPWHETARRAGVRSSSAFPIRLQGAVIGSINLYGSEPDFFTDDLLSTLDEMAMDVSFALDNFVRAEALRTASQVVEASPVVLFRCRPQPGWPLEYISENVARWGYPAAVLLSGQMPFSQLVYPEDLPRVDDEAERYTREGRTEFQQEYRIVTADGRVLWMEDRTHVVRDGEGRVLRYEGVLTDITERRQAHEALKDMLNMLQALIQASPEAITIIEANGRIRAWNPGAERIFGWREEEVLGLPLPTILAGREEEYRAFRARVLGGDTVTDIEAVRQRKDGARITINLSAAPLRDARGRTWGIVALMTDITERKLLEAQAKRTDRLAVLGQLLGGIAHELKNPLFVVTGRLQLMKEKLAGREYDSLDHDLQRVEEAARRMTTTTQRFLSLATPTKPQWSTCSIQAVLDSLLEFTGHELIKNHIQVVKSFAPDLPETWTEPHQLNEAFLNLVLNAMQAMASARGKGTLTIATTGEDGWIAVRIQDDGPGIAPEHMAKLFEPFFTTKPPDVGTGLGLWTVRATLAALSGTIGCESEWGRGATFTVKIPIVAAPTAT